MMKSRPGRSLVALRDSEVGAAVSGVWPAGWKTGAFAISAAYGAVGGSMLVFVTRIAAPETGGFATAIALLTGAVLGGLGTISGAVIGALAVVFVPYYTSEFMAGRRLPLHPRVSDGPRQLLVLRGGRRPDPGQRALRRPADRRRLRDAGWHRLLRAARALEVHPLRAEAARASPPSGDEPSPEPLEAGGSDPTLTRGRTNMRKRRRSSAWRSGRWRCALVAAACGDDSDVRRRRDDRGAARDHDGGRGRRPPAAARPRRRRASRRRRDAPGRHGRAARPRPPPRWPPARTSRSASPCR